MATENQALERYLELKKQIEALEKEMDGLKDDVLGFVNEQGGSVEDDRFTAKTQKRPKYKFSDDYEQKNAELKGLRKKEIDDGVATVESYSEFFTLRLREEKEE